MKVNIYIGSFHSFLNYMELSWRGFLKALLISPINQIVKHISFFCHCSIVYVWLATGLACLYLISSFMHNSHSVLRSLWTLLVFLKIISLSSFLTLRTIPKQQLKKLPTRTAKGILFWLCYLYYDGNTFENLCLDTNI